MNGSLLILFWGTQFESRLAHYLWLGLWYAVWVIGYTFCTTSTQAAMNVVTNDPKQRTTISALINVLIIPMQLLIINFGMNILQSFGGAQKTEDNPKRLPGVAFCFLCQGSGCHRSYQRISLESKCRSKESASV